MVKIFSFFFFIIFLIFNKIFLFFTKRDFLIYFKEFIEINSYEIKNINNKKINFFSPNNNIKWRVKTLFSKEPETLDWIDKFKANKEIIFWDIGANIGLYSIYAAAKFNNIKIYAFEPSTSNLRILSRNISINNFENKIFIFPSALSNEENKFHIMKEKEFNEGGSLNSFGVNYDFEGKDFSAINKYSLFGTSINYLLESDILKIPNYIKIDVDGIEHLILKGADNFLKNKNIQSVSIELNENFKEQHNTVLEIMKNSGFKLIQKKHAEMFNNDEKFSKSYNYLFEK